MRLGEGRVALGVFGGGMPAIAASQASRSPSDPGGRAVGMGQDAAARRMDQVGRPEGRERVGHLDGGLQTRTPA